MNNLLQTAVNAEEVRRHSNASIDMKLEVIVIWMHAALESI